MKEKSVKTEIDDRLSALISNASAVRAITGAVEGTIGPKGLDTMLVDRSGDIIITNAGVTILDRMEVSHPAAHMLINIARAQHEEVGDGTTTATIMAGTIISEGLDRILKGVPVAKIIDGIEKGINKALDILRNKTTPVEFPDDPMLEHVALIAGRGMESIASNAVTTAKLIGKDKLMEPSFKLKDSITAVEGAESRVLDGIIIKKKPLNHAMPKEIKHARILCLDDALEAEKPVEGNLNTEMGYRQFMKKQEDFEQNLVKIIEMGVNLILTTRGVSDKAEEILTDCGVLTISRLTSKQMRRTCEHTGASAIKKTALDKSPNELEKYLGSAGTVYCDLKLNNIRIQQGGGKPAAAFVVGSPTQEVAEEKERIASDSVSAVQAAIRGGILAGGGAAELSAAIGLMEYRNSLSGMSAHGVDCVIEALKQPIARIIQNAGFNPLEKVEEVITEQIKENNNNLGIDCDTGKIVNMMEMRVVDPTLVKLHALKAAGEVARAILRINTIIKMREERSFNPAG